MISHAFSGAFMQPADPFLQCKKYPGVPCVYIKPNNFNINIVFGSITNIYGKRNHEDITLLNLYHNTDPLFQSVAVKIMMDNPKQKERRA